MPYSAIYSDSSDEDTVKLKNTDQIKVGSWIIVNFLDKPYPGKVVEISDSDDRKVKVKCLQKAIYKYITM